MPAVSFTAPQYDQEDEKRDRASLPEEERIQIENEVYGRHRNEDDKENDDKNNTSQSNIDLEELEAAVQEAIDNVPNYLERKRAYLQAMELCPDLVQKESSAVRFLRANRYDATISADKILDYWSMRSKLFGGGVPDENGRVKAFEPMTLCGAMRDDHNTLCHQRHEIISVLEERDEFGRIILFSDKDGISNHNNNNERNAWIRALWYVVHVALQEEESKRAAANQNLNDIAFVWLNSLVRFKTLQSFDRIQMKCFVRSMLWCLPIRVEATHVMVSSVLSEMIHRFSMVFFPTVQDRCRVTMHRGVPPNHGNQSSLSSSFASFGLDFNLYFLVPNSAGKQQDDNPLYSSMGSGFLSKRLSIEEGVTYNSDQEDEEEEAMQKKQEAECQERERLLWAHAKAKKNGLGN